MLEVSQLKNNLLKNVQRQMRLLLDHLLDHLDDLALEHLVIIVESFDQQFQLGSLLLIDDGGQEIVDEVLEAVFVEGV